MNKRDLKMIKISLVFWRIFLFAFLFLATSTVVPQMDFLGGGLQNYLKNPGLWSWLNFDGEHYLSISFFGYKSLQYFYFPIYPMVIGFIASLFNGSIVMHAIVGLAVSHVAFLIGLVGLIKLMRLDYKSEIASFTVLLLLFFPTSFYFASFYTESLFFALVVWSFYFARQKKWFYASLLGGVASATKVVGIVLLPALVAEYLWGSEQLPVIISKVQRFNGFGRLTARKLRANSALRSNSCKAVFLLLIPAGLIFYMIYLKNKTGDPLEFFHSIEIFGQQRTAGLILLPQVFYRYIFKIIPNINYDYFPVVFATWLEFVAAIVFGILAILGFLKLRLSYAIYLALGYLIPTLSGSFSSLPRYVLVLFPGFILASLYLVRQPRILQIIIFTLLFISLGIATAFFVRGYWIA